MKINDDISNRIDILRFPLIVGVVLIHSYGFSITYSDVTVCIVSVPYSAVLFQTLVSWEYGQIAVPLFFFISGFLYFVDFKLEWQAIGQKFRARVKTLLTPYLFWNCIVLLFFAIAQFVPWLSVYFSGEKKLIADYKLFDYFDAIFGLDSVFPIARHFWFIRDLMILIFLSPLFYLAAKYTSWFGALLLSCIWFTKVGSESIAVSSEATLFFFIGLLFSRKEFDISWVDRHGRLIISIYLCLSTVDAVLCDRFAYSYQLHRLSILLGIMSVWYLSGRTSDNPILKRTLVKLSALSFFVYAAHEPALRVMKKILYRLFQPSNGAEIIFIYLLAPLLIILACLVIAIFVRKHLQHFYQVITGYRGAKG
jgi:peptidoglycan/LPS O-acetylase OafA/YrhL